MLLPPSRSQLSPVFRVTRRQEFCFLLPSAVPCRQSVVSFVTVAPSQHRPSPGGPTNSSILRAQQLAGHLHTKATASSPTAPPKRTKSPHRMSYTTRRIAAANTLEHRIFVEKDGQLVSPWHDIPLYANEQQTVLNMVVEVPRWTNAKMEVCERSPTDPPCPHWISP